MANWMLALIALLIIIIVYRTADNLYRLNRVRTLHRRYRDFLRYAAEDRAVPPEANFVPYRPEALDLFRRAGLEDRRVPINEPAGYGKLRSGSVSVFDNLATPRGEVAGRVDELFWEAAGEFRRGLRNAVNPLSWIELILFLPANLFAYLGARPASLAARLANVAYWLLAVAATVVTLFFSDAASEAGAWLTRFAT